MPDTFPDPYEARQKAFGDFLRSRRERLTPDMVGLAPGLRRRTQGLRREEVALLAGVGATWYTWLEQGRDVRPSAEVLGALATALRLDAVERRHLFTLAGRPAPQPLSGGPERVPEPVMRMLRAMTDQPAYVVGRRWDILAWNDAAVRVFGDFSRLDGDARNQIHMMFADPAHRALMADWDELAPVSLAMFRASSAAYAGDADFERLIGRLKAESVEFRDWWPRQDVEFKPSTVKRIRHPSLGLLVFEYTSLEVTGCPGMRAVVCTPAEGGRGEVSREARKQDSPPPPFASLRAVPLPGEAGEA